MECRMRGYGVTGAGSEACNGEREVQLGSGTCTFGRETAHYGQKKICSELDGRTALMERIWDGAGRAEHLLLLVGFTEYEPVQATPR